MTAGVISLQLKDATGAVRLAQFWSDDGTTGGNLTPISTMSPAQFAAIAQDASLQEIRALLAAALTVNLPSGASTAANQATAQTTLASILAELQAAPLPTGAATSANQSTGNATLASILTALQAQRSETLWTDDTEAYYVRLDQGGTIVWTTITGGNSGGPGSGARPVSGPSAIVDRSPYQAVNAGTGYSVGDLVDHIVVTDPTTGAIIGHFWLNTTQETKLAAAPLAADISPVAPLPTGAATDAHLIALTNWFTGSTGTDFSVNAPTLPTKGNAYGATGLYANYILLKSVPANPSRKALEINNTSGVQLVVIFHDGTAIANGNLIQATQMPLAPGTAAGAQGGSYSSTTFKGACEIYAPAGNTTAFVSVKAD